MINDDEGEFFLRLYHSFDQVVDVGPGKVRLFSKEAQDAFIKDIEDNGFYLVRPPHKPLLYSMIKKIYEEFPWIKPYPMYINLFGVKKRRLMKDGVVGSKYIIVLKQNSNKNFSARSTFRVSRANLPTKDIAKKTNRSAYARTAVRLSEIYNLLASVSGEDLAEYNIFTRSSALGRKSLQRILAADGNPLELKKLKIHDNYINTNADILAAKLKGIGLRIHFYTDDNVKPDMFVDAKTNLRIGPYTIMASPSQYEMYRDLFDRYEAKMKEYFMMQTTPDQKQLQCWQQVFDDPAVREYNLSEDDKNLLITATRSMITLLDQVKTKSRTVRDTDMDKADPGADGVIHRRRGRKPKVKADDEVAEEEA